MVELPPNVSVQQLEGKRDLTECHAIRRVVFVEEQNVSEGEEWDDLDSLYTHCLLKENGQPAGTARFKVSAMNEGKLGRFCLLKEARGKGLGMMFLRYLLDEMKKADKNLKLVEISAQTTAVAFYEKAGFVKTGGEYMEANIPHYTMTWNPDS